MHTKTIVTQRKALIMTKQDLENHTLVDVVSPHSSYRKSSRAGEAQQSYLIPHDVAAKLFTGEISNIPVAYKLKCQLNDGGAEVQEITGQPLLRTIARSYLRAVAPREFAECQDEAWLAPSRRLTRQEERELRDILGCSIVSSRDFYDRNSV